MPPEPSRKLISPTWTPTKEPAVPESPYVGIRPYTREDESIFFGRERSTTFLTNKIFASPLTLFYGRSGLGKSSLLHAKVIPELEYNAATVVYFDQWSTKTPAILLHATLTEAAVTQGALDAAAGGPTLTELVRLLGFVTQKSVVLIFDQFEEFLVWHGDKIDQVKDPLVALLRSKLDVHVVISMREEYLAALEPLRRDIPNIFQSTYRLGQLDERGVYAAITRPLEQFDGECKPEFIQRFINDLRSYELDPDLLVADSQTEFVELPILQLVCSRLWALAVESDSRVIDVELYTQCGGLYGILDNYVRSIVPTGFFNKIKTADLLRVLAPPSGLKMSFSVDDLVNLSELHLCKNTIHAELQRLESHRILKTRKFLKEERFELLHDAFIGILTPWIRAVRCRADRYKHRFVLLVIVGVLVLSGGVVITKRDADSVKIFNDVLTTQNLFLKSYNNSVESRLVNSEKTVTESLGHSERIRLLIEKFDKTPNREQIIPEIKQELKRFQTYVADAALETTKDVETNAAMLPLPTLPSQFFVHLDRSTVTITGKVPNLNIIDVATRTFGSDKVNYNDLTVAETVVDSKQLESMIALIELLKDIGRPASLRVANRVITLQGVAPTFAIRTSFNAQAKEILPNGWSLDSQLQVPTIITVAAEGDSLYLTGQLSDQNALNGLLTFAKHNYSSVQDDVSVGERVVEISDLDNTFRIIKSLNFLQSPASIDFGYKKLTITGAAINGDVRENLIEQVQQVIPADWRFDNQINIPPSFVASVVDGELTLVGELPNQTLIENTLAVIEKDFGIDEVRGDFSVGHSVSYPQQLDDMLKLIPKLKTLIPPASIEVINQQLTISGIAMSQYALKELESQTESALPQSWTLDSKLKFPPSLSVVIGEKIVISGELPDQDSVNATLALARNTFGASRIESYLNVNDKANSLNGLTGMIAVINGLKNIEGNASFIMSQRELTISGIARSEYERQALGVKIKKAIAPGWELKNLLSVRPTFKAKVTSDRIALSGMLPSQQSIDNALNRVNAEYKAVTIQNDLRIGREVIETESLDKVFLLLHQLKEIAVPAFLSLDDKILTVSGEALNNNIRIRFYNNAQQALPTDWRVRNHLTVPPLITFEHNSDIITDVGKTVLEQYYLPLLAKYDTIQVGGHTDSVGDEKYNVTLSLQRADATKKYLLRLGLKNVNLTTKGYSDSVPVDCTTNEVGRTPKNRRIEFYLDGELASATCSF